MKKIEIHLARGGAPLFGHRLLSTTFTNLSVKPNLTTKQ